MVSSKDQVLGFGAVLLGAGARGATLTQLRERKLLSSPVPDAIVPGSQLEQRALAYLHVNCGMACHNPSQRAEAWWTGFYLRLNLTDLASLDSTKAYQTGVRQQSYISSPSDPTVLLDLIEPGQPDQSALVYRDSQRKSAMQMPPLATHVVDAEGLELLRAWILEMPH